MRKCKRCNVYIDESNGRCPLCDEKMEGQSTTPVQYPQYALMDGHKYDVLKKLLLFFAVSSIIITVFINVVTKLNVENLWSLTVAVSIGALWMLFLTVKSDKLSYGGKVLKIFFVVAVYLFLLDLFQGFNKWSTTYVIPFLIMGVTIKYAILVAWNKRAFNQNFGYLLAIAFLSLVPIILYFMALSQVLWISLVATLTCVIIGVGLYIFEHNQLKAELNKRFHM